MNIQDIIMFCILGATIVKACPNSLDDCVITQKIKQGCILVTNVTIDPTPIMIQIREKFIAHCQRLCEETECNGMAVTKQEDTASKGLLCKLSTPNATDCLCAEEWQLLRIYNRSTPDKDRYKNQLKCQPPTVAPPETTTPLVCQDPTYTADTTVGLCLKGAGADLKEFAIYYCVTPVRLIEIKHGEHLSHIASMYGNLGDLWLGATKDQSGTLKLDSDGSAVGSNFDQYWAAGKDPNTPGTGDCVVLQPDGKVAMHDCATYSANYVCQE